MTDSELLQMCEIYGRRALEWRNKFIGLLPEVEKRKLFLQRGCSSIYEFGKKFAGLSEEQVSLAIHIERRFEDKPLLRELLVSGEVSLNKLSRVVSVATVENQQELAEKVRVLPVNAIKTMVRDMKSLDVHKPEIKKLFSQDELRLDEDVRKKLEDLQNKGIDINNFLRNVLDNREAEIEQQKKEIAEGLPEKSSRYIPQRIKKILKSEFGEKCSITHCQKPAEQLHHAQRYGLARQHNPNFLAPFCKDHHIIAHSLDVRFHEMRRR